MTRESGCRASWRQGSGECPRPSGGVITCLDDQVNEGYESVPAWRADVDLDGVQLALEELDSLLRSVAATGASMLIKVDGERTDGVNPKIFTVVVSGIGDEVGPIRVDDADLGRAVHRAVKGFDTRR